MFKDSKFWLSIELLVNFKFTYLILFILSIIKSKIIKRKLKLNNITVLSVKLLALISLVKKIKKAAKHGTNNGIIILKDL